MYLYQHFVIDQCTYVAKGDGLEYILWLPKSPDVSLLDFLFWGYVKDKMFVKASRTLLPQKAAIYTGGNCDTQCHSSDCSRNRDQYTCIASHYQTTHIQKHGLHFCVVPQMQKWIKLSYVHLYNIMKQHENVAMFLCGGTRAIHSF